MAPICLADVGESFLRDIVRSCQKEALFSKVAKLKCAPNMRCMAIILNEPKVGKRKTPSLNKCAHRCEISPADSVSSNAPPNTSSEQSFRMPSSKRPNMQLRAS